MTCFDNPRHQQKTHKWNGAYPEKHSHCGCRRIDSHRRNSADNEWSDRGNDTAGVVTEAGTRRTQSSGKEFGQVVGERAEDAEHRETDKEITVEAVMRREVESERCQHRNSGKQKVNDVHRFAPDMFRQWNREQRSKQSAKIEYIRGELDPFLNQLLGGDS